MKKAMLILFVSLAAPFAGPLLHAQAPSATTAAPSNIKGTSATAGGTITQGALTNILVERGVIYAKGKSLTTPPTTSTKVAARTTGTGAFTCGLTGLSTNTHYTVWAYVSYKTSAAGVVSVKLGGSKSLLTAMLPTVTTTAPSAVQGTTATSGGNVSSDGRMAVTARGVVWGTAQNPTVSLSTRTTNGAGIGAFVSSITGLSGGTTYFVRAYATNGVGTAYGAQHTITTTALPDLQARPTSSSNVNRPRFRRSTGGISAAGVTYVRIPDQFCAGLSGGTREVFYPCALPDSCEGFKHAIALQPVVYSATNTGAAAAGAFSVALHRQTRVNGTLGTLVQVAASNVTGLSAGANSANFSFTPPGTVDVYRFPDDNPGLCFVRCDPEQGGCVVPFEEEAYQVKVDGGNAAGAAGQVAESNEANNEGNPMP